MRKLVAFSILFITSLGLLGQGNFPVWDKDYAWGGNDRDFLKDIHQNETNYSITAAGHTFTSNNQDVSGFNRGLSDYWVVQVDTGGVIQFENNYGGDSTDQLALFIPTPDNGYLLAGSSASGRNGEKSEDTKGGFDYWLVKISSTGTIQWDRTIGGPGDDILTCASADVGGGFILGGYSNSEAGSDKTDTTFGNVDYWIVKVGATGSVIWDVTLGGDSIDKPKNILVDGSKILVGGSSISNQSGVKSEDRIGGYDYWLTELNSSGDLISDTTLGGNQDDFLEELRLRGHDPGYWISGTTFSSSSGTKSSNIQGQSDIWILNVDEDFNVVFDRTIGSGGPEECKDMEISPEGSAILAGWSSGSGGNKASGTNGGVDFWIFKMDTTGNVFWDRNYGGSLGDSLEAIFIKCDRGILAGGSSESLISGDRTHANKGNVDYWAFELSVPTHPYFRAQSICNRTPLNFYDESDVWPDSWEWNFDDPTSANNISNDQHPIHTFANPGVYNVSMTIKEGCQKDTTIVRPITVFENTVLGKVDLGRDFSICGNAPIELSNQYEEPLNRVTYSWSTGDSTETILIDTMGVYTLTVSDLNCSDYDVVVIDTCPDFGIPNAFTPNGDDINEVFRVYSIGINEFELLIFNRWGQLIYQSKDINEGWDGTYKGNQCQQDVYVYKLIYRGLGLSQQQQVGRVSLIR